MTPPDIEKFEQTIDQPEVEEVSFLAMLAEKYGTDKLQHGYIPLYEENLPELKEGDWMLEIGAFQGASLRMWREFFPSGVTIATIENFGYDDCATKAELEKESFYVFEGSQDDIKFLSAISNQFNLIIDDGDHRVGPQQIAFKHLFVNNIKTGGLYVIEDIHTSDDEGWSAGIDKKDRTLYALQEFLKTEQWGSKFFEGEYMDFWKSIIDKIEIFENKIAFIWKK